MDGASAKMRTGDGEYVGWAKRTQCIEIDFNYEIRMCYTWRGTPSMNENEKSEQTIMDLRHRICTIKYGRKNAA
jgi:hypothetical protein